MAKLSLRDLDVRGKRVLVRVDFNVPIETHGGKIRVTDDTRIRETLPTINYLREHGAKTILMSHFGRPKGKRVEKYSLRPIGDYLHSVIHHPVIFSHDTIGDVPKTIIDHMQSGDVALLENLRFQRRGRRNKGARPWETEPGGQHACDHHLGPHANERQPHLRGCRLSRLRHWVHHNLD